MSKKINFSVESAILRELGEQLVSKPEVAITELVKNAFDADSPYCKVIWDAKRLKISDSGHGMTESDFRDKWMRIATGNKGSLNVSKKYSRPLTGSKGIGRFAARFLGHKLTLVTTSKVDGVDANTTLIATFNWKKLDEQQSQDLSSLEIRYRVYQNSEHPVGTSLFISNLRYAFEESVFLQVKKNVLQMISPMSGLLENAPDHVITKSQGGNRVDPGFDVSFQSPISLVVSGESDLSRELLNKTSLLTSRFYTKGGKLFVCLIHDLRGVVFEKNIDIDNVMGCDVYGDIRFIPHRAGVLAGKVPDAKKTREWINNNSGVTVYDKGFRVPPYGLKGNDWLHLVEDGARSRRHWRSNFMVSLFPMSVDEQTQPSLNPMIALPSNHQLIGSVFVSASNARVSNDSRYLSPNMDRQGFIENEGYQQLEEITRFAVELIAKFDRVIMLQQEEEYRRSNFQKAQDDISETIQLVEKIQTLSEHDKRRIVKKYESLKNDYNKLTEHDQKSRENLVTMGLLGVVAGFMTHEYQSALHQLEGAQRILEKISKDNPELQEYSINLKASIEAFTGYVDYTQAFVVNVQQGEVSNYKVLPQIRSVVKTFAKFREERKIEIDLSSVDPEVGSPNISIAMYRGIVHNLYSNALKALSGCAVEKKIIKIEAYNTPKGEHVLRVLDNGIGISSGMRQLIWDPLFTTTSTENNPLGSGMGLGLSLIKRLVESLKGKATVEEPSAGFNTCFEIRIPMPSEKKL